MCGIIGVYNIPGAAAIAEQGLEVLLNRGQDATGIATANQGAQNLTFIGGEGTPDKTYDLGQVASFSGQFALGQNRYTTNGDHGRVQPTDENDNRLSIVHNGNLSHPFELQNALRAAGVDFSEANDTKQISLFMGWEMANGTTLEEAAKHVYDLIRDAGSFCIIAIDAETGVMIAMRDPRGIRPMVVAEKDGGHVVASETNALEAMGIRCTAENEGSLWRDVKPAELLIFDESGMRSEQLEEGANALDAVEFVYLASEKSVLYGQSVRDIRERKGAQLAIEHPMEEGAIIVGVPNTAMPFAEGYARQLGKKPVPAISVAQDSQGMRSFMLPDSQRAAGADKKLEVDAEAVKGKIVYVIDDSVFRGTVQKTLARKLHKAGAAKIVVLVGSPPVIAPNNLGVATKKQDELVAHGRSMEEIARELDVDEIYYLSLEGMRRAINPPPGFGLTMPDFTGENSIARLHQDREPAMV